MPSPPPGLYCALAGGGALRSLRSQGRTQEFLTRGFFSIFYPLSSPFRVRLGLLPGAKDLEGAGCQGGDEAGGSLLPDPSLASTSTQECKFLNQVSQALALGRGRVAAVR